MEGERLKRKATEELARLKYGRSRTEIYPIGINLREVEEQQRARQQFYIRPELRLRLTENINLQGINEEEIEEIGELINVGGELENINAEITNIELEEIGLKESDLKSLLNRELGLPILYRAVANYVDKLRAAVHYGSRDIRINENEVTQTLEPLTFHRNVINHSMNECLDISFFEHNYSGKLHSIITVPIYFFHESNEMERDSFIVSNEGEVERDSVVFTTLTSKFEIVTLHNSLFGSLTFSVNTRNHNYMSDSIQFIIHAARLLIWTGGLAGYSEEVVKNRFKKFTINITSSSGGIALGTHGGARFYRTKVGPFNLSRLLSVGFEVKELVDDIASHIFDTMMERIQYITESPDDNTDINDWRGNEIEPEGKLFEQEPRRRFEVFQRRMEDVTFKFYPITIEPINVIQATPRHFMNTVLEVDTNRDIIIPNIQLRGDVDMRPLDPDYHKATEMNDNPFSVFRYVTQDVVSHSDAFITSTVPPSTSITLDELRIMNEDESTVQINSATNLQFDKQATEFFTENPRNDDILAQHDKVYPNTNFPSRVLANAVFRSAETTQQVGSEITVEEYQRDAPFFDKQYRGVQYEISLPQLQEGELYSEKEIVKPKKNVAISDDRAIVDNRAVYFDFLRAVKYFKGVELDSYYEVIENMVRNIQKDFSITLFSLEDDPYIPGMLLRNIHSQLSIRGITKTLIGRLSENIKSEFNIIYESQKSKVKKLADYRYMLQVYDMISYSRTEVETINKEYDQWLHNATQLINKYYQETSLGCITLKEDKLESALARLTQIWSPDDANDNDCFLRCLIKGLELDMTDKDLTFLRYKVGHLDYSAHIHIDDTQQYADHFSVELHYWRIMSVDYSESSKLMLNKSSLKSHITHELKEVKIMVPEETGVRKSNHKRLDILIQKNHCYLLVKKDLVVKKVKCSLCTQWINRSTFHVDHAKFCHYCLTCRKAYSTKRQKEHQCRGKSNFLMRKGVDESLKKAKELNDTVTVDKILSNDWICMKESKLKKKITTNSKIWLADFEAFPSMDDDSIYTVYAAAIIRLDKYEAKEPIIFYGEKALEEYLEYLDTISGTLYYFNGSVFDNYLHIRGMIEYDKYIDSTNFIKQGSRIISFNHSKSLKVHDLYLFVNCSLAKACKDWGVPQDLEKKEFDHSKVYDWRTVNEYEDEVSDYISYDVISLACLYHKYSTTMFKCFNMDVNKAVTPSQFAMQCWSAMTPTIMKEIFIPHTGKEENDDRAAYYGGRVMCQRKEYKSSDYDSDPDKVWSYDDIDDFLIDGDVNSLYPTAQVKFKYAYGKWTYIHYSDEQQCDILRDINILVEPDVIHTRCYCVDVKCPKDLITSFLISRNEKGDVEHNLKDKVKQWYWGYELEEAILIGYVVTYIYQIKCFPESGYIFNDYVYKCWEGRKLNPKPSIINLAYKNALCCLTGKFGQKSHITSAAIYNTSYKPSRRTEKDFEIMMKRVVDFDPIFSDDGSNSAIILELQNDDKNPNYPIYLSGQILANSRVYMSRIMRKLNAYLDPLRAIYYTDTDSLILPANALPILKRAKLIGDDLGQLSCDLGDPNDTYFAKIVRAIWSATKGPYALVYLKKGDTRLKEKVRVKGIPHSNDAFDHHEEIKLEFSIHDKERLYHAMKWIKAPYLYSIPTTMVRDRFYMYKSFEDKTVFFARHINFDLIKKIMLSEGELCCFFGGMKRSIMTKEGKVLSIRPSVVKRIVCRNNWWSKNKRGYLEDALSVYDLSYPPEYEGGRSKINYNFDWMIREAQKI